jgi:NTE family protein
MPLATAVRISCRSRSSSPRCATEHADVYVDGGVQLNYPVKLFDRERYIDMANEPDAARDTDYYNKENALFELERPGRSPYVYNRQTLGLRLDTREEIGLYRYDEPLAGQADRAFTDYARAAGALLNAQENQHLHSDDWHRTVYIDTLDVKTTDFEISSAMPRMRSHSSR